MNTAVGIDVSKGKSVVAAMRPFGEVAMPPQEFLHTSEDLSALMQSLCLIFFIGVNFQSPVIEKNSCSRERIMNNIFSPFRVFYLNSDI